MRTCENDRMSDSPKSTGAPESRGNVVDDAAAMPAGASPDRGTGPSGADAPGAEPLHGGAERAGPPSADAPADGRGGDVPSAGRVVGPADARRGARASGSANRGRSSRVDDWCGLLSASVGAVLLAVAGWLEYAGDAHRRDRCPNPCAGVPSGRPCRALRDVCPDRGDESLLPWLVTVLFVVGLLVAFVPGWVRAMRLPHPRVAGVIMGVVSALAVGATWLGGLQLVYVAAFAVFAVFIGEMVRKDRSGNRLEQIAGTYVGCLIALSGAFWVVLVDRLHGGLAPVVAVCILSGSLGRYATGGRFERVRRSGWLIAWLTFYAYIGGLVLVFVIGPPYLLKAFVWVFGVALIYGVVAGLTDLAARSLKGCRVAISLAVVPHCALGVISYAAALFLS